MNFYVTTQEINNNIPLKQLFCRLQKIANGRTGFCYYKYPLAGGVDKYLPGISILDKQYGILALDAYEWRLDLITKVQDDVWIIDKKSFDSPLLRLQDYRYNLIPRYEKYRELRGKVEFNSLVILPSMEEEEFKTKYPDMDCQSILFGNEYLTISYDDFWSNKKSLNDKDWTIFVSVSQGANALSHYNPAVIDVSSDKMGEAIEKLNTRIALLDNDQQAAAIQIPEGPQSIRGLAGTGKTVVLAMKAAYFHQRYPEKKILYTFNTQSLYGIIKRLITRFYRQTEDHDPNWENLQILHAWGGRKKDGVYYRTCIANNFDPVSLRTAQWRTSGQFFDYVCKQLLDKKLAETYDCVLIDEGQDFDPSFYKLIYKISKPPKRIIFAYDELQSLNNPKALDAGELFGTDEKDSKLVDLSGSYDNGIEKEYVLKKSYRNPSEILMTAHGIGLGIYNIDGPLQMIDTKDIWYSVGYEIEKGNLKAKEDTIIKRPLENSPSPLIACYSGKNKLIDFKTFKDTDSQLKWIADNIYLDINKDGVQPHEIVVISLNPSRVEKDFIPLQRLLLQKDIKSVVPGVDVGRDIFTEEGFVTFSTVYKAKGNEASIVYVINFDFLYDYAEAITARNMAFTSISRAKGWCRIVGIGDRMERASKELQAILENLPKFHFTFPDMKKIRRLSEEVYVRRAAEQKKVKDIIADLLRRDKEALENLSKEEKEALMRRLGLE